ncbi:peptidylprolyl isomerase [Erythrobacter sp. MTPC3]|uniref:peptidylprolyl isomerase n=1 Tax=Erythrobacter sp. MTPC3 TaxID=3056564 RepID=UPI0036F2DAD5
MRKTCLAAAAFTLPFAALAQDEPTRSNSEAVAQTETPAPSPNAIVDAAPETEWVQIAAEDLLVMTLAPDAEGNAREVVLQLMPAPFSQGWVENIRTLARAKWYDGISVNRVQDNYVVQWGDPGYDNPESGDVEQKALPDGLKVMQDADYTVEATEKMLDEHLSVLSNEMANASRELATIIKEMETIAIGETVGNGTVTSDWRYSDPYALSVGHSDGWAYATDVDTFWPVHCYGMVGVGRNYSPDTGSGAELYTVIGHAPRHLDRNIALVGRIISGMEHLSSLPRGSGELGFYTEEEADKRTPIVSVRVASDLPDTARPAFEYLSTESQTFAAYAAARANRRDPFFIEPAGGADICNIPVPVRPAASE